MTQTTPHTTSQSCPKSRHKPCPKPRPKSHQKPLHVLYTPSHAQNHAPNYSPNQTPTYTPRQAKYHTPHHYMYSTPVVQCNSGVGTNAMYEQLYNGPVKFMVLGAGCSTVSEATAIASHIWNVVQVGGQPGKCIHFRL